MQHELAIRQKKIKVKDREIQTSKQKNNERKNTIDISLIPNKHKKELRYLFFSNGGIIGYYNDDTYTGCPKCDFSKSNILAIQTANPSGTYVSQRNGSLLLNNGNIEKPTIEDNNGSWALINYKWHIKPPQN